MLCDKTARGGDMALQVNHFYFKPALPHTLKHLWTSLFKGEVLPWYTLLLKYMALKGTLKPAAIPLVSPESLMCNTWAQWRFMIVSAVGWGNDLLNHYLSESKDNCIFFMYWELAWTFVQYSRGMSLSLCRFSELLMKMQRDEICA